jgi:hypothetical protein
MFDIEVDNFQNIPVSSENTWGIKKYNFPVSYRINLLEEDVNSFNVVSNEGNVVPYIKHYLSFLIISENYIFPENIKVKFFGNEHPLNNLSFYMISHIVNGTYNQTYLEIYDLPASELFPSIKIDNVITITEIEGFWKFDLENRDFSIYVESLARDLRFLFC